MIRLTLRGLFTRKMRTALTIFAIVLGVSMISGTYILTDATNAAFNRIFAQATRNINAVVSGRQVIVDFNHPPTVAAGLEKTIAAVPGVKTADGEIANEAQLFNNKTHKSFQPNDHAPSLLFAVQHQSFNELTLVSGHLPTGREITLDKDTMYADRLHLGSKVGVATSNHRLTTFVVVGTTKFGAASLGATLSEMSVPMAQMMTGEVGRFDQIAVMDEPGVTSTQIVKRIKAAIGPAGLKRLQVRTGEQTAKNSDSHIKKALGFLTIALLAFAGIAVFVGAFIIFNTFSITVAQRIREFGLLRTVGATRGQILRAVLTEATIVGVIASVIGLVAGLGIAQALSLLFKSFGANFADVTYTIEPRTAIVAIAVGMAVTIVAAIMPAIRATRVPPIAAMRSGLEGSRGRITRWMPLLSLLVFGLGIAATLYGLFASISSTTFRLQTLGAGVLLIFLGVAMISPRLVRPLAAILGWPIEAGTAVTGMIARDNAERNPTRTAVTASSLMIGLALVVFVTIFATEIKKTADDLVTRDVAGSFIVEDATSEGLVPIGAANRIAMLPGVELVSPLRSGRARITTARGAKPVTERVNGIDPVTISDVYRFQWKHGSTNVVTAMGTNNALVSDDFASSHNLRVGSTFSLLTSADERDSFTISGIFKSSQLLDPVLVPDQTFARDWHETGSDAVVVQGDPGVKLSAIEHRISGLLRAKYPTLSVLNQKQFKAQQDNSVNKLLIFIYVLLFLSVVISGFGIVNTLVLSIYERTREIGMLRAIGSTRTQIRWMIRWESVITSVIGAVLGVGVGAGLAALLTSALASQGIEFALPGAQLPIFFVLAVILGIVAAILPARRAARLDILAALAYE